MSHHTRGMVLILGEGVKVCIKKGMYELVQDQTRSSEE